MSKPHVNELNEYYRSKILLLRILIINPKTDNLIILFVGFLFRLVRLRLESLLIRGAREILSGVTKLIDTFEIDSINPSVVQVNEEYDICWKEE